MNRKRIILSSDADLRIFMHPTRQNILHLLSVRGPMTIKMLATSLSASSSSAKHHVLQLAKLGLVEIDHKEQIHGITATYYRRTAVEVSIGAEQGGDRELLAQNLLLEVEDGFFTYIRKTPIPPAHFGADMRTGVVHLTQEEADSLNRLIADFLAKHEENRDGTLPFAYALLAYRA